MDLYLNVQLYAKDPSYPNSAFILLLLLFYFIFCIITIIIIIIIIMAFQRVIIIIFLLLLITILYSENRTEWESNANGKRKTVTAVS